MASNEGESIECDMMDVSSFGTTLGDSLQDIIDIITPEDFPMLFQLQPDQVTIVPNLGMPGLSNQQQPQQQPYIGTPDPNTPAEISNVAYNHLHQQKQSMTESAMSPQQAAMSYLSPAPSPQMNATNQLLPQNAMSYLSPAPSPQMNATNQLLPQNAILAQNSSPQMNSASGVVNLQQTTLQYPSPANSPMPTNQLSPQNVALVQQTMNMTPDLTYYQSPQSNAQQAVLRSPAVSPLMMDTGNQLSLQNAISDQVTPGRAPNITYNVSPESNVPQQVPMQNPYPVASPLTATQMSPQNAMPDSSTANYSPPGSNGQVQNRIQDPSMTLRIFYKHLPLILNDQKVTKGRYHITNPSGCVIYHDRYRPRNEIPNDVTELPIPLEIQTKINPNNPYVPAVIIKPKDADIIRSTCKDMIGGVHIECDNGCIYATRYSITHVYCWANDDTTPKMEPKKLDRKQKTLVFDLASYERKIRKLEGNLEAINKEYLPVVVFTFGFAWIPSTALKDTHVHAEVTPVAAVKCLADLSNGQITNGSINRGSVRAEDVNKSNDPLSI